MIYIYIYIYTHTYIYIYDSYAYSPRPRLKRSEVPMRIPSVPHLLIPSPVTPTPEIAAPRLNPLLAPSPHPPPPPHPPLHPYPQYTLTAGFWRPQDLGSRTLFSKATFHGVAMQAPDAYLRQTPPTNSAPSCAAGRRKSFKLCSCFTGLYYVTFVLYSLVS